MATASEIADALKDTDIGKDVIETVIIRITTNGFTITETDGGAVTGATAAATVTRRTIPATPGTVLVEATTPGGDRHAWLERMGDQGGRLEIIPLG